MSKIVIVFLVILVCSNLYHLMAAFCSVLFRLRNKPDLHGTNWPKAACLKPLCGYDFQTSLNIKSFLDQDYPEYEVIFGTADQEDSAYALAQSVCHENKVGDAKTVSGELGTGTNRKIRNVRNIEAHISSDAEIIVLSDSDTRVTRNYLKYMIAPMRNDQSVGAVTSLYKVENVSSLGALIEALAVESTFVPGVLVASTFSDLKYAFGASIALRRSELSKSGGFSAVEEYLADDYKIGNIIYKRGKRVILSSYVVTIIVPKQNLRNTLGHLVRWNRTIRVCEPTGYFFSILSYSTLWAVVAFAIIGVGPIGWMVLGGNSMIRILTAAVVAASIESSRGVIRAIFAPIWDLLSSFLWLSGLVGNRITWRGVKYRLSSDGRMVKIHNA